MHLLSPCKCECSINIGFVRVKTIYFIIQTPFCYKNLIHVNNVIGIKIQFFNLYRLEFTIGFQNNLRIAFFYILGKWHLRLTVP